MTLYQSLGEIQPRQLAGLLHVQRVFERVDDILTAYVWGVQ